MAIDTFTNHPEHWSRLEHASWCKARQTKEAEKLSRNEDIEDMGNVTAEHVRDAMIAAGIERADHHECSICHYMCAYFREDDRLYFDPGCDCNSGGFRSSTWQQAADWINMQSHPRAKENIARRFGIGIETA
jgi:hypothetical protein